MTLFRRIKLAFPVSFMNYPRGQERRRHVGPTWAFEQTFLSIPVDSRQTRNAGDAQKTLAKAGIPRIKGTARLKFDPSIAHRENPRFPRGFFRFTTVPTGAGKRRLGQL